jgi:hypothetical protein
MANATKQTMKLYSNWSKLQIENPDELNETIKRIKNESKKKKIDKAEKLRLDKELRNKARLRKAEQTIEVIN